MGLPRSRYVQEGQEGVYHCFSRCVRRAFLYGFDPVTGRDFSHRKAWLLDRLRQLASVFAIEVCAYALMINHYHLILRTRPDIVAKWTDWEVATRWLTLFPRHRGVGGEALPPLEEDIVALVSSPERIAVLRKRLCSLSWIMGRLNEFMARMANKEDKVKGRFWEGRFKCQALLDETAIAACMVYVDLNPIRAGVAATPEDSDFASIQERIQAWQAEQNVDSRLYDNAPMPGDAGEISTLATNNTPAPWLCPISSESRRRGILQMTETEYFDLVDKSGRLTRTDKHGAIEVDLAPILLRIGANPDAWLETISHFGYKFHLAAGLVSNLCNFAHQLGRRWLSGVSAARTAFVTPRLQRT